jgi:hypothetical protein
MTGTESTEFLTKGQYRRVFRQSDWRLFREVAESYLIDSVRLKTSDLRRPNARKALLIRNIRKRLFLGVGCELLLKAAFLKKGYAINKLRNDTPSRKRDALVTLHTDTQHIDFNPDETHKFDTLLTRCLCI